jgi:hypothetical protein
MAQRVGRRLGAIPDLMTGLAGMVGTEMTR